jgi:pimeloyl-ACP methyl ester carboxylesterase
MKIFTLAVIAAAAVYIGLCWLLYARQNQMLYFPAAESNPRGFNALRIPSGDAVIKVWQLHADVAPALLYFGGNAEDVAADLTDFDPVFRDRAVYLVNYRGYGGSTGAPSEAGLVADAQAVYDALHIRHEHIAVMGRSLGSGVATALAATRPVEKLILVTPYDSIANVAADHFGWVPVRWLLNDRYDSARRMSAVGVPVLVMIAEHDEVIFRPRSDALIAAIPTARRQVLIIPGATHNDLGGVATFLTPVQEFLAKD